MLKFRVIPTILWNGPSAVKGERFNTWRKLGPVMPAINIYVARGVDEISILNLAPNDNGVEIDYASVSLFFKNCNLPLTYGGGIVSLNQVETLLSCGVDKISVGSSSYKNDNLVEEIVKEFGSQFLVCSIDYKKVGEDHVCYSQNGKRCENVHPVEHAKKMEQLGVGEILLNSIDHDGLMQGYDLQILAELSNLVKLPIIISGGAGSCLKHFSAAAEAGANAVAASSTFLFTEITPRKVSQHLHNCGYATRV